MIEFSGKILCFWRFMFWELLNYEINFFDNPSDYLFNFVWVLVVCVVWRNWSISSKLSNFWVQSCFKYSPAIFWVVARSLVIFSILLLIMPTFDFFYLIFINLVRDLSVFLVYSKGMTFCFIGFFCCFTILNFFDFWS